MKKPLTLHKKDHTERNFPESPVERFMFVFELMELARSFTKDATFSFDNAEHHILLTKK